MRNWKFKSFQVSQKRLYFCWHRQNFCLRSLRAHEAVAFKNKTKQLANEKLLAGHKKTSTFMRHADLILISVP